MIYDIIHILKVVTEFTKIYIYIFYIIKSQIKVSHSCFKEATQMHVPSQNFYVVKMAILKSWSIVYIFTLPLLAIFYLLTQHEKENRKLRQN